MVSLRVMPPWVASVTQVVGVLHAPMAILLSIGAGLLVTTLVIVFMARHRSAYRKSEALAARAADPPTSRASPLDPISSSPDPVLSTPGPMPAPLDPDDDDSLLSDFPTLLWSPTIAPPPWAALEPVIELEAPGPGVLGRLRRRPLADLAGPRQPLKALEDDAPSRVVKPNSQKQSGPARSRSSSRSSNGPKTRQASGSVQSGSVQSGSVQSRQGGAKSTTGPTRKPSPARTAPARNAARTSGPSGARRAGGSGGTASPKRARPVSNAAKK